jgi:hypothetical protein
MEGASGDIAALRHRAVPVVIAHTSEIDIRNARTVKGVGETSQ